MRERPVIAIDGPSGAGKTTASKLLAERTGLVRLDTGAMYRACALAARRAGIPWTDGARLGRLCADLPLSFLREGTDLRIVLSGEDVSEAIRSPEISMGASDVSAHKAVREAMVRLQRTMGEKGGVVLEGRDTGTVVFPDAALKIFLTASPEVRAQRRYNQLIEKGIAANLSALSRDLAERDARDANRAVAPLVPAPDSQVLDSSALSVEEVADRVLKLWHDKVSGGRR